MRLLFEIDKKDYDPHSTTYIRPSVRGIILEGNTLAMVFSEKYQYYKFPGGGLEKNESHQDTLLREVKEETGLTVIPQSIEEYGIVHRKQKGEKEDIFIQDNYYYLCKVNQDIASQNLDTYENEEGFTLRYVSIDEAVHQNMIAIQTTLKHHRMYQTMMEREIKVLQYIQKDIEHRRIKSF